MIRRFGRPELALRAMMWRNEHRLKLGSPMPFVRSFPPIATPEARVLVLGSMPGIASLAAGEYYAHPRNAFWKLLGQLLGFDPANPYRERVVAVQRAGIAVWDVLQSCERVGSLDTAILPATESAQDFGKFFRQHRALEALYFNGTKAETTFRRHVLPGLKAFALPMTRLPSTSPANASIPWEQKLAAWRQILPPVTA